MSRLNRFILFLLFLVPVTVLSSDIGGHNRVSPDSFSNAQSVQNKINAIAESIKNISRQIQQLIAEIQREMANKPKKPDTSGMSKEAGKRAHAHYEMSYKQWQDKVERLNRRIQQAMQAIDKAQKELQKLGQGGLPSAQRKDAQTVEREMQRQREALKRQRKRIRKKLKPCPYRMKSRCK
jgi:DNA repair exonuclease SbcCD ATPase subunit